MSPVRVVAVCACLVVACDPKESPKPSPAASTTPSGAASPSPSPSPSPSSPTPAPSTSTTPSQLCDRYVALSDPDKKLDAKARAEKHTRCEKRADGMKTYAPAAYVCVVDCTLAAKDYAAARKCRRDCAMKGGPGGGTEGGKGVLGGPPGGGVATGGIKGAPSGSASAADDDDD